MAVDTRIHDVLGVGFGPSNLALAVALRETSTRAPLDFAFVERKPEFVWHGSMLLDDSCMQISFLKDLVMLRNPSSRYTFINYLHAKGRLMDFINLKTFFPSRHEFNDYLRWVADDFGMQVSYDADVLAIEPVLRRGVATHLRVRVRDGRGMEQERLARNVVVSVGGAPAVPQMFAALRRDPRVLHSSSYLEGVSRLAPPRRVAVVGAGQSAAEIFMDLQGRYPGARIDLVTRSHAIKPADDSPFVNEVFNPEFTDYLFQQPAIERRRLLQEYRNTNYAVVDLDLIERIYETLYQQKVRGQDRLRVLRLCEVREVSASSAGIALTLGHVSTGAQETADYDLVVLATGYRRDLHSDLVAPLRPYMAAGAGEPLPVARDYRLLTTPDCEAGVYLQGCCEETHGLSDTLLSILPTRAQEIADALAARLPQPARPRAEARAPAA